MNPRSEIDSFASSVDFWNQTLKKQSKQKAIHYDKTYRIRAIVIT
jgi:hypothetical protein